MPPPPLLLLLLRHHYYYYYYYYDAHHHLLTTTTTPSTAETREWGPRRRPRRRRAAPRSRPPSPWRAVLARRRRAGPPGATGPAPGRGRRAPPGRKRAPTSFIQPASPGRGRRPSPAPRRANSSPASSGSGVGQLKAPGQRGVGGPNRERLGVGLERDHRFGGRGRGDRGRPAAPARLPERGGELRRLLRGRAAPAGRRRPRRGAWGGKDRRDPRGCGRRNRPVPPARAPARVSRGRSRRAAPPRPRAG